MWSPSVQFPTGSLSLFACETLIFAAVRTHRQRCRRQSRASRATQCSKPDFCRAAAAAATVRPDFSGWARHAAQTDRDADGERNAERFRAMDSSTRPRRS